MRLSKMSTMTMASGSIRWMIRQLWSRSGIRSSWHRVPTVGRARECGIPRDSPLCSRRKSTPASIRADGENGGVFTSPLDQTKGLAAPFFFGDPISDLT